MKSRMRLGVRAQAKNAWGSAPKIPCRCLYTCCQLRMGCTHLNLVTEPLPKPRA